MCLTFSFDSEVFVFQAFHVSDVLCLIETLRNVGVFIKIINYSVDLTVFPCVFQ